jgi:hypothetical protein
VTVGSVADASVMGPHKPNARCTLLKLQNQVTNHLQPLIKHVMEEQIGWEWADYIHFIKFLPNLKELHTNEAVID